MSSHDLILSASDIIGTKTSVKGERERKKKTGRERGGKKIQGGKLVGWKRNVYALSQTYQ